MITMLDLDLSG